jgi:hypothetical protein
LPRTDLIACETLNPLAIDQVITVYAQ